MDASGPDISTRSWSITSWLGENPTYIAVLLTAILVPLVLFIDRIGIEPAVPAKPMKAPANKEAKKDK